MAPCSHITDSNASSFVREIDSDTDAAFSQYADVDERPPHYLREWREYRRMTVRELATEVGTSPSTISDLENYKLQLSPKWLRRLAPVLETQQGYLIDYAPDAVPADIFDLWSKIAENDREQAARTLRSFTRTGTDD